MKVILGAALAGFVLSQQHLKRRQPQWDQPSSEQISQTNQKVPPYAEIDGDFHPQHLIGQEEFNPFDKDGELIIDPTSRDGKHHGKHHGKGHHGKDKYGDHHGDKHHRAMRFWGMIMFAILFTCLGCCITKCCMKRKNCAKKHRKMMELRNRTSRDIEEQIKQKYDEVLKLEQELQAKREQEARQNYQQAFRGQGFQVSPQRVMVQPHYPQQQPQQPQYRQYENMREKIPVGKPINQSFQSEEYPQL